MQNVEFLVGKVNVFDEVGRMTNYAGAKKDEDKGAFVRIATTGSDEQMLEPFWQAACSAATEKFKPFLTSLGAGEDYHPHLELSGSYDVNLTDSINESLKNFFVCLMVSKWYDITNPAEAEKYGVSAAEYMDDVVSKIYYKKKPTRVVPVVQVENDV